MVKIILALLFSIAAMATPSCYEIYKIDKKSEVDTAVFILIDETTPFNDRLKEQIISNSLNFVKPGNSVIIGKFSAMIDGKYNETLFDFNLDMPLSDSEKYELNKNTLGKVDKCLKDQMAFVRKSVESQINSAFGTAEIAKSDIFYALKDFAKSSIVDKEAKRKVVILASDMLENSSITSFYANNAVRQIDAKNELKKVGDSDFFADFGNADVFVIGTGITKNYKKYINAKQLSSFSKFWSEYFEKSNARLVDFGTPALKSVIK